MMSKSTKAVMYFWCMAAFMREGARYKSDNPTAVIRNWMRNRGVIEFLGFEATS